MNQDYQNNGYFVKRNAFSKNKLKELEILLSEFHERWKIKNQDFYQEKAVNSAYLTNPEYLTPTKCNKIFELIGSHKVMELVRAVLPKNVCFLNTQLFFDPYKPDRKNYWHRDPQYHLTIEEQKQALSGPEVIHVRIPTRNERGIELIPGTHRNWDTDEELNVRLEQAEHKNHEDLSTGKTIELNVGDVLVFSANMIHRGLYGKDRLTLDLLFFDSNPEIAQFVEPNCLPDQDVLDSLDDPSAFLKIKEILSADTLHE